MCVIVAQTCQTMPDTRDLSVMLHVHLLPHSLSNEYKKRKQQALHEIVYYSKLDCIACLLLQLGVHSIKMLLECLLALRSFDLERGCHQTVLY